MGVPNHEIEESGRDKVLLHFLKTVVVMRHGGAANTI